MREKVYLVITMVIPEDKRLTATKVYKECRTPFLNNIPEAISKELLIREEDVQVLHGFDS